MLLYIHVSKNFKNIFIVSFSTFLSRISGFARDAIFFSIFGISEISAAFLFAFTIPNLFRRLLGEGALSSAVIPILSKQYVQYGENAVRSLLNKIVFSLSIILIVIISVGCTLSFFITKCTFLEYKWTIGAHFIILVLPYMFFVCITAIISAALNVLGYFFVASLNAIWLNISMILSLIAGKILHLSDINLLDLLSFGVVFGGVLQYIIPSIALKIKIKSNSQYYRNHREELHTILKLFWPGIFGAAITQINLLTSRSLAYIYSATSVSILYLANRLIELPLGIFAIAISTVFFPDMSKSVANFENDPHNLNKSFNYGILSLLWILLPSAVGLFSIRKEILNVFFEWGNFGIADTNKVLPIIGIYSISIPFYGISTFLIRSFHSIQDMKTPVHIGYINFIINIVATLILMQFFGITGIATANTIAVIIQTYLLYIKLKNKQKSFIIKINKSQVYNITCGLICIYSCVTLGHFYKLSNTLMLFCITPLAAITYLCITFKLVFLKENSIAKIKTHISSSNQ